MLNAILTVLSQMTVNLPVGTNLGLLHLLWMLMNGSLLSNRGALFPALKAVGLSDEATRRAWTAFRSGQWQITDLLVVWRSYVKGRSDWQEHRYEGYLPVPVDITAFWRPKLKKCPSQHYHPVAKRALPAVIFAVVGEVGHLNGQRLALLRAIERVHPQEPSEGRLWQEVLRHTQKKLTETEILVVDAGVKVSQLHDAEVARFVVRLATNFTGLRNRLPEHTRGRKPIYGALVRPLPRRRKGKLSEATIPDETYHWLFEGRSIRVEVWRDLVLPKTAPAPDNKTVDVYAFHDPTFKQPWLLATSVKLHYESVRALYTDRWPIEQIPLSAKQMVGAHRQFVHNPESIQRLPELALLAGSLLSFLAATLPAVPTGFWDRQPRRTPGRLRRTLFGKPFPKDAPLSQRLREKRSVTAHLPKGNLARQQPATQNVGFSPP